jgi:polyisoprenoid-binding protein YceI
MTLRRVIIALVAAVGLVFVLAAAGWWFFIREDNELASEAPEVPADLEAGATPGAAGDATVFVILPDRSEAAYFADEKLASLPLPSTAKGSTKDISGTFYLSEDGLDLDPERESAFTVDLTTIKSDRDMRDRRVQSDGLQTAQFPTATFTATSVTGYDPSIAPGQEQNLQLTGILDLHGVQKEVTWDVKARRAGNVITATATLNFPYSDFNIPVLNIGGFVTVEEDVTLQVQIVAQGDPEAS